MKAKIQEVLGQMQYRRFWHRDHERRCNVVCVDFRVTAFAKAGNNEQASIELAKRAQDTKAFVEFLSTHDIETYVHHGPTGAVFAAVVCSDENKLKLEKLL